MRKDLNHVPVAGAFEALGCVVVDTSMVGDGGPDMFVLDRWGIWHAVEVKNPENWYGKRGLTIAQKTFSTRARGYVEVILTSDDVVSAVERWRRHGSRRDTEMPGLRR